MLSSAVKSKLKMKLQSWSRVHKYLVFIESFLGEKSAKITKGNMKYESLEMRQLKGNQFKVMTKVLEAAKFVKRAEGSQVYHQAVQQLHELLIRP